MEWVLLAALFFLGLPAAGLVVALRTRTELRLMQRRQQQDAAALALLGQQLSDVEKRFASAPSEAATPDVQATPQPVAAALFEPPPQPTAAAPIEPPVTAVVVPPVVIPPVEPEAEADLEDAEAVPASDEAGEEHDAARPDDKVLPPRWPRLPPLPSPSRIDWESLVGVKLFSWIAGVALVFAAVFFLRYSIEHGWLSPSIRMATGLLVGTGLLVICELRAAQRYPVTANALDAAGIAILFSTLFASHALWHLLPQLPVFVLMTLVTAVAVLLSVRRESVFIALLGLIGGFATPALLSTGEDRPIGLFGYLLLLNVGAAWVAYRKRWPLLTTLSVVFTAFYQWAWVLKFLDPARLSLAMGIFIVFPLLHVRALVLTRRDEQAGPSAAWFERTAVGATALPLLLSIYMAAVPAYGAHYALLFSFLFLVAAGLATIAILRGPELLHAIGGVATLVALAVWFVLSYRSEAWPGVLGFVAVLVLLYLCAPLIARRLHTPFTAEAQHTQIVAPLLLFAFAVLAAIEPAVAAPGLLFSSLFILLGATATVAIILEAGSIHFLSALFALAAEAVWSALHLTPERLLPALVMYAAFGLFYLGVPLLAEQRGRRLEPQGSGAVVLFVSLGFLFFLAAGPIAQAALWGMALLLAILNLGLFFEASRGRMPLLSVAGVVLSWIVIAVWWATAMVAALLVPSLLIVAGFAALVVAGNVWAEQGSAAGGVARGGGSWLALVGHLFLLFVASQATLAVPPWPLFGVLTVLDLAIGAAALYTRRARLHTAALMASQLVLMLWVMVAQDPPWPLTSMVAAGALTGLALAWIPLARRRGSTGDDFARAAIASIFLAQVVVICAAGQPVPPAVAWLATVQVLLLMALLGVASGRQWFGLAVWAVVLPTAQGVLYLRSYLTTETWGEHLLFALALYAPFVIYPLWLGKRAGHSREPYLAAVLASVSYFVLARQCMMIGGLGDIIAVLPVAQAVVILGLLARLLGIEEPSTRRSGRVALVAGAALAFVTVAIPLQLDREWITIGWALECTALAWLYRKIPHIGLLAWSTGLALAVMIRLCVNPAVFDYHSRSGAAIFNWYLYTYLTAAAALFAAARLLRETDDRILGTVRISDVLPGAASVLLFLLLNIEIADFYSTGTTLTFNLSAGLAQDLTYTIGWALFAIGLLSAGIGGWGRLPRFAALALLVVTVVKCFLHDLWQLGGLYRVGSFVALAFCLALVAVLMQRFVLGAQKEAT